MSLTIYCKHVSTGIKIDAWRLPMETARYLSGHSFCYELNKRMSRLLYNTEDSDRFDIIYHMHGEHNISQKIQNFSNLPLLHIFYKKNNININDTHLAFYAKDHSLTTPPVHQDAIPPAPMQIITPLEVFENNINTCCVCGDETNISCNIHYDCGTSTHNSHYICNSCQNGIRTISNSQRCPICRAPSYASLL